MNQNLPCPHCGRVNQAHADTAGQKPAPVDGDVSVCWGCTRIAVFIVTDLGTSLRVPTPDEQAEYDADEDLQEIRRYVAQEYTPSDAIDAIKVRR